MSDSPRWCARCKWGDHHTDRCPRVGRIWRCRVCGGPMGSQPPRLSFEEERDRYRDALELIRATDPVDAALDPGRAIRVAREALRDA